MEREAGERLLKKWKRRYEEDLDEFRQAYDPNLRDMIEEDVYVSGTRYYELKIALKDLQPSIKVKSKGGDEDRRFEQY